VRTQPAAARLIDVAPTILAAFGLADPTLPGRAVMPGSARGHMKHAPRPPPPAVAMADENLLAVAAAAGFRPAAAPSPAWRAQRLAELAALLVMHDPPRAYGASLPGVGGGPSPKRPGSSPAGIGPVLSRG
jgi:hypothetical protein